MNQVKQWSSRVCIQARSVTNFLWYYLRYYSIGLWIVPSIVLKTSTKHLLRMGWRNFFSSCANHKCKGTGQTHELIRVGLGNLNRFLQVNMIFCGGFGTIRGTIWGTIFFPLSPRNTNTKEHQHPLIHRSILIVVGLFPPTPINYKNLPRRSCPLLPPSLPSPPLPQSPPCPGHRPHCCCGHCCPCCPRCLCRPRCPSRPSRPCPSRRRPRRPRPRRPCYCPHPPPPPYYPCELWSHVTTPVMISTKNSTQAGFFFLSQRPFRGTISAPTRK